MSVRHTHFSYQDPHHNCKDMHIPKDSFAQLPLGQSNCTSNAYLKHSSLVYVSIALEEEQHFLSEQSVEECGRHPRQGAQRYCSCCCLTTKTTNHNTVQRKCHCQGAQLLQKLVPPPSKIADAHRSTYCNSHKTTMQCTKGDKRVRDTNAVSA